jgi:Fe2+ transport system protein B
MVSLKKFLSHHFFPKSQSIIILYFFIYFIFIIFISTNFGSYRDLLLGTKTKVFFMDIYTLECLFL